MLCIGKLCIHILSLTSHFSLVPFLTRFHFSLVFVSHCVRVCAHKLSSFSLALGFSLVFSVSQSFQFLTLFFSFSLVRVLTTHTVHTHTVRTHTAHTHTLHTHIVHNHTVHTHTVHTHTVHTHTVHTRTVHTHVVHTHPIHNHIQSFQFLTCLRFLACFQLVSHYYRNK